MIQIWNLNKFVQMRSNIYSQQCMSRIQSENNKKRVDGPIKQLSDSYKVPTQVNIF
jgi:hypothetical protein